MENTNNDDTKTKPVRFESNLKLEMMCREIPQPVKDCMNRLDSTVCREISMSTNTSSTTGLIHKMIYRSTLQLIIDALKILTLEIPFCNDALRGYNTLRSFSYLTGDRTDKLIVELKKHPNDVVRCVIHTYENLVESIYLPYH
jgi:hypothetical protein